jgi:hypothetical protein
MHLVRSRPEFAANLAKLGAHFTFYIRIAAIVALPDELSSLNLGNAQSHWKRAA